MSAAPNNVVAAAIPSASAFTQTAKSSTANAGAIDANLVFNIDVFLLAFVGLFFLLSLPRAAIRFSHSSEWFNGHFLRYVDIERIQRTRPKSVPRLRLPSMAYMSPTSSTWLQQKFESEKSPDLKRNGSSSSQAKLLRNTSTASSRRRLATLDLPTHMPNWTTMLPTAIVDHSYFSASRTYVWRHVDSDCVLHHYGLRRPVELQPVFGSVEDRLCCHQSDPCRDDSRGKEQCAGVAIGCRIH